jgi:hypothetical protein
MTTRKRDEDEICVPEYEPESLGKLTPHILDETIQFVESTHTYSVRYDVPDGPFITDGIVSTSGLIHHLFPSFNPSEVITKMRRSPKFVTGKYQGMTDIEIKEQWTNNGLQASGRGTKLHFLLECHQNGYDLLNSEYRDIPEVQDYFRWHAENMEKTGLIPFRTELRMTTGADLKLTGTADLIAVMFDHPLPQDCDGVLTLHIIDWKFSREIKTTNFFEKGFGPCEHMPNCNHAHYLLQQNVYQWMIETYYNKWTWRCHKYTKVKIASRHLAIFHPNHGRSGLYMSLPDIQPVIEQIMQSRRCELRSANNDETVLDLQPADQEEKEKEEMEEIIPLNVLV